MQTARVVLGTAVFLAAGLVVMGQRPEQRTAAPRRVVDKNAARTVPAFDGRGATRTRPDKDIPPPRRAPAPWTPDVTGLIVKQLGAMPKNVWARVTPSQQSAGDRAALVLVKPKLVDGGQNYAHWDTNLNAPAYPDGFAVLWIHNTVAGRRYVIDCVVSGFRDSPTTFLMDVGTLRQRSDYGMPTWPDRLLATLTAHDVGWHSIAIANEDTSWYLHSCDVSFP